MIWREGGTGNVNDGPKPFNYGDLGNFWEWDIEILSSDEFGYCNRMDAALSNDLVDDFAEVFFEALAAGENHAAGVKAELVQNCRVHVGDVVAVLDGVEAEFVGGAVGDPTFNTTAGHPDAKAVGVVVATVAEL